MQQGPEGARVKSFCLLNMVSLQNYSFSAGLNYPQQLISLVSQNPIFHTDMQNESEMLIKTLNSYQKSSPVTPIQKIYSQSGVWYCTLKQNIALAVLVTIQYPVTSAMRLLKKIESLLSGKLSPLNIQFIQMQEPNIKELLNQYDNNCYTDDVLDLTAKSMDSIQGHMEDNIKKIVQNQQALQVVHHKSEELSNVAGQFQKDASQLKTKMQCQQYLIYGAIGLILAGVTLYILYRIF